MGTGWRVIVPRCPTASDSVRLKQEIIAKLEQVEQQMSHWRVDSLVSRFNRSDSTQLTEITPELAVVIGEALRTYKLSDGAFDVTSAPLVNLWGFGPTDPRRSGEPGSRPTEPQIAATRRTVGSDKLHLVEAADGSWFLSKTIPELQVDLSALAKGYAIDLISEHLNSRQIENFLIEVGGEVLARGTNERGALWQIGLEQPDPRSIGQIRSRIALRDRAIATSGSYRNFTQATQSDEPISHLIDPRTGRPVAHKLVSVSVIEATAMGADAWATALIVLGPEAGFDLASKRNIAATFVVKTSTGLVERSTEVFETYVSGLDEKQQ